MKPFFLDKFQYQFDTNVQFINLLLGYGTDAPKNTLRWMSHIFNAQEIWNRRILNEEWKYGVWQIHAMPKWHKINEEIHQQSLSIISSQNLDRNVTYQTIEGKQYTSRLDQILFHIVNHSTYHRGQIAYELREKGLDPIGSDYIFYNR